MSRSEFQNLTFPNLAGDKVAIFGGWEPYRSYKGGVAGDVEGIKVRSIAFANGFSVIEVKLPGVFALDVSNEEVDVWQNRGISSMSPSMALS